MQRQSLEIAHKVIEFDNFSNGFYSSEQEQEDVEILTTEHHPEQKYDESTVTKKTW